MPTSHRTDRLQPRIALGDDGDLHLRRPIPALAGSGEDLDPVNPAGANIIT